MECSTVMDGPRSRGRGPVRTAWLVGGAALVLSSARVMAAAPSEPSAEPPVAASPAGDAADVATGLRVEVGAGIDDAALLPGWIADRHRGLTVPLRGVAGLRTQWIDVQITGSTYDYQVTVTAVREGEPLSPPREPTRCECTSEELLALVDVGITAAVAGLRTPVAAVEPAPVLEPSAVPSAEPRAEPAEPEVERPRSTAPRGRLGALGHAGIGVGVLGAGLAIAGLTLALRPEQVRGAPGRVETRDVRTTGIVLGTAGGVVLATGLALLVVELVVPRERATAFVPAVGPGHVGVGMARRF